MDLVETLNANLTSKPTPMYATELRDGRIAVWRHSTQNRKGSAHRIGVYNPSTDTYEGEGEDLLRAALVAPQPGSLAAVEQERAARRAAALAGSGDVTGGHDAAPRAWRAMNSDF